MEIKATFNNDEIKQLIIDKLLENPKYKDLGSIEDVRFVLPSILDQDGGATGDDMTAEIIIQEAS